MAMLSDKWLNRIVVACLLLGGVAVLAYVNRPVATPEVFDTRPFAQSAAAAEAEGKVLVIKATAEWCGPCKMMDRTTLADERVVTRLRAMAVTVAVDVDAQQQRASELGVTALPTVIAKVGEREVGRFVGYRDAEGMLAWLDEVAARAAGAESAAKSGEGGR